MIVLLLILSVEANQVALVICGGINFDDYKLLSGTVFWQESPDALIVQSTMDDVAWMTRNEVKYYNIMNKCYGDSHNELEDHNALFKSSEFDIKNCDSTFNPQNVFLNEETDLYNKLDDPSIRLKKFYLSGVNFNRVLFFKLFQEFVNKDAICLLRVVRDYKAGAVFKAYKAEAFFTLKQDYLNFSELKDRFKTNKEIFPFFKDHLIVTIFLSSKNLFINSKAENANFFSVSKKKFFAVSLFETPVHKEFKWTNYFANNFKSKSNSSFFDVISKLTEFVINYFSQTEKTYEELLSNSKLEQVLSYIEIVVECEENSRALEAISQSSEAVLAIKTDKSFLQFVDQIPSFVAAYKNPSSKIPLIQVEDSSTAKPERTAKPVQTKPLPPSAAKTEPVKLSQDGLGQKSNVAVISLIVIGTVGLVTLAAFFAMQKSKARVDE